MGYDGLSALALAEEEGDDLVLGDIGLPGIGGDEVAKSRRRTPARPTRLVALSGAQPEDVTRSIDAGFDAHFAKAADLPRLQQLLTELETRSAVGAIFRPPDVTLALGHDP